jgi:hypothetical protein
MVSWFKLTFYILFGAFWLFIMYLHFFVCGGFEGTISDIPRWCWWIH